MTGVSVTIDDSDVRHLLDKLQNHVSDLSPVMDAIGAQIAGKVQLSFNDGRDPWGHPWEQLSPVTVARRRNGSNKPLRDTSRLMNSITHKAGRDHVEVGTNVEYAGTHQFGAKKGAYGSTAKGAPIPWGDIPARPFMPIDSSGNADLPDDWRQDILDALINHFE